MKFLEDLAFDQIKEEETENTNNKMRNEKEFKKRISEIAAKIAGVNEAYDAEDTNLPSAALTKLNSVITNSADLAKAIDDIIKEIIAREPGLSKLETMNGWSTIFPILKRLSGEKKGKEGEEDVPEVTPEDEKMAGGPKTALQEAFNRINRK